MSGARFGAVLTGFFPDSVRDAEVLRGAVGLSAEAGFDCVEFYYDGPENRAVAAALRGSGLSSVYHPAYPMKKAAVDLGAAGRVERLAAVGKVKVWVERAAEFGCEAVMLLSGGEVEDEEARADAIGRLEESLKAVCQFAASFSPPIEVRLESFNNRGEPRLLMGPSLRCRALAEAVRASRGNFGLTFDLSHSLQMGENPAQSVSLLSDCCSHVHLANCVIRDKSDPLFGDKHPPFGRAGGEVDEAYLADFIRALGAIGFFDRSGKSAILSLEVITGPRDQPAETLAKAKEALDRAWLRAGR
ncbi:MAG: TIM barrel protein [Treponemataceae bacterium]